MLQNNRHALYSSLIYMISKNITLTRTDATRTQLDTSDITGRARLQSFPKWQRWNSFCANWTSLLEQTKWLIGMGLIDKGWYGMFVACGIYHINLLLIKPIFSVLAHAEKQFFSKLVFEWIIGKQRIFSWTTTVINPTEIFLVYFPFKFSRFTMYGFLWYNTFTDTDC